MHTEQTFWLILSNHGGLIYLLFVDSEAILMNYYFRCWFYVRLTTKVSMHRY